MDVITTRCRGEVICTTKYDEEKNLVTAIWEGYADLKAVKNWGKEYLDLMKKYHCACLLNDDRNSSGPWAESIEWIEEFLVPSLKKEGLKYYAHIVSYNLFASVSADKLQTKLGVDFMRKFLSVEEGEKWLIQMQNREK